MGDRAASPWSDQSDSALARDAGIDDIGRGHGSGRADGNSGVGLFDQASNDQASDYEQDNMDLDADDSGSDGGSDYA
jgi:hypothetical protein